MDAKTLAADIRKAVRAATKTAGDPLHGLRISVRKDEASLMSAVDITVLDLPDAELIVPEDDREPGHGWATDRAQAISNRLHEIAAPALDWADDRHSFCSITFDGLLAPAARPEPSDTLDPELCDVCTEVLGACDCDELDAEYEARNTAERAELTAAEDEDPCRECVEARADCGCDRCLTCDGTLEGECECPREEAYDHSRAKEDTRNAGAQNPDTPACPNGHGPMRGSAEVITGDQVFGIWHTCTTPDCRESYIRPSQALVETLASQRDEVRITPQPSPVDDVQYGTRRGALAAVR